MNTMAYKKAYTELNEIIKILSKSELEKIPEVLIKNIKENMDNSYNWKYDSSKSLLEQEIMPETKSLIVEIYEKYLSLESEKDFWKRYDDICIKYIEEHKKSVIDIFKNNENEINSKENNFNEVMELTICKKSFFNRILDKFKNLIKNNKK